MAEAIKLMDQLESILSRIQTMLQTQFTEEDKNQVEEDFKACSEKYTHCLNLAHDGEGLTPSDKELIDDSFNEISMELRNLNQIHQRQKAKEKLLLIQQKFFQMSPLDACRNNGINLEKELEDFKRSMENDECLQRYCQELLDELEDLIKTIQAATKRTHIQVGIEDSNEMPTPESSSCARDVAGRASAAAALANTGRHVTGGIVLTEEAEAALANTGRPVTGGIVLTEEAEALKERLKAHFSVTLKDRLKAHFSKMQF